MADQARIEGSVDISIDVGKRLHVRAEQLSQAGFDRLQEILQELAELWTEEMLEVWPVRTRRSQQNWVSRIRGLYWQIGNPVTYAEFVHVAGDQEEVWRYLDAHAEQLLADALPRLREVVESDPGAGRQVAQGDAERRGAAGLFSAVARAFQRRQRAAAEAANARLRERDRNRTRDRDR